MLKSLLSSFFLFLAPFSPASGSDAPLTLRAALARALTKNSELAGFPFDSRAAEARIFQAGLKPNPEVSVLAEDLAGSRGRGIFNDTQTTIQLNQLIELGGKRQTRIAEAQAGRALVQFDYEIKRLEVLSETAQEFYEVLGAQRRVALSAEIVQLITEFAPAFRQRADAGKASAVEETRNEIAMAAARIGWQQARGELASARRRLASAWDAKEPDFGEVLGDLDQLPALDRFPSYLARLSANPAIVRWDAEKQRRNAAVARELAAGKPDLTVSAGPRWRNGPDDATLVAGFSIPLPFQNKNEGNIREARILVEKIAAERRATEAKLTAELGAAFEEMSKARAEIEILAKSVLPSANKALKAVTDGYAAGKLTQLDVLEARRTITDSRTQYLQALVACHKAAAQLDALCGGISRTHSK